MTVMNNMITELKENEIFVFGSNKLGHHAGGAARLAYEEFGAVWGIGYGFRGKTYAIPTLDEEMKTVSLEDIKFEINQLVWIAERMTTVTFYLTPIGTGIAGYSLEDLEGIVPELPINIIPTWKIKE